MLSGEVAAPPLTSPGNLRVLKLSCTGELYSLIYRVM